MVLYFRTLDKVHGRSLDPVRKLSLAMQHSIENLSDKMDRLCTASCPECTDVCCERARIWYDFKDLVYHYFAFGCLPWEQIRKIREPGQDPCCSLMTEAGCSLPRSGRPFVCTWYICPVQKAILQENPSFAGRHLPRQIDSLKETRDRLEDRFCRITGNPGSLPGSSTR